MLLLPVSSAANTGQFLDTYYKHVVCVSNCLQTAQEHWARDSGFVWVGMTIQTTVHPEQERTQEAEVNANLSIRKKTVTAVNHHRTNIQIPH